MEKKVSILPAIIIIVMGLVLAIASYEIMENNWREEHIVHFDHVAQEESYLTQGVIEDAFNSLISLRDFYDASQSVTSDEFNLYTQSILDRYHGVNAFFWFPIQTDTGLITFFNGEQAGLSQGFDITSIPALVHLRDQIQSSDSFILVSTSVFHEQPVRQQGDYIALLPIYKNQQLAGYIGEAFNLHALLQKIKPAMDLSSNIEVSIEDAVHVVYHHYHNENSMAIYQRNFDVGGFQWGYRQDLIETPRPFAAIFPGLIVFFSVFVVSLLIALYSYAKSNQHLLTEELVRRRTQELHLATTRLKQRSLQLGKANIELQQFAYVASHDLQEPLRMIYRYAELIRDQNLVKEDENAREFLHYILDAGKRMQQLIEGLLQYSRVDRVQLSRDLVDLNDVVLIARQDLQNRIVEKNAIIEYDPLPKVYGDKTQLTRLFQNLMSNALKYCDASQTPHIVICAVKQADEWIMSVKDNGIGIEKDQLERIFDVFQRLHTQAEYEGTGIGLSICQRIVERHDGHIWVESTPGEGATFFFSLPTGEANRSNDGSHA